jgi:ABC-type cobalamin/Fe3+-siderophores transport system ATPase subunit
VLHEPDLLLLDEPRSHLDPEAAGLVESLLGPAPGRTRVLVTHDVEAGLAEADVVLALRAGGSVAYAGPASGLSAGDARAVYGAAS